MKNSFGISRTLTLLFLRTFIFSAGYTIKIFQTIQLQYGTRKTKEDDFLCIRVPQTLTLFCSELSYFTQVEKTQETEHKYSPVSISRHEFLNQLQYSNFTHTHMYKVGTTQSSVKVSLMPHPILQTYYNITTTTTRR